MDMRKEIFIALFIGLSLGLIVAFGVKTARQSLKTRPAVSPSPLSSLASSSDDSEHSLLITEPEPDEILNLSQIKVIGTTTPDSLVSVVSLEDEDAVLADETGAFSASLELTGGPNPITVTSFNPQGSEAKVDFTVIYSTSDLIASSSAQKTNTKESK